VTHLVSIIGVDQPDLFYARQQMAVSLGWHMIIACFGVAFPSFMLFTEWRFLRTGDELYRTIARRWSKAMGVLFAVGAVSGTILSFEFGILWPEFMGHFGDVFGIPFALEGFAFFIEAIFLAIYLYGWNRLKPKVHFLTGLPVAFAGLLAAFWVIAANGWMNGPKGFTVEINGEPLAAGQSIPAGTDPSAIDVTNIKPWSAVFNSALWHEIVHMLLAAFMVAGFVIAGVYAYAWLKGKRDRYHRLAFIIPFSIAAMATPLQLAVGDWSAQYVGQHQPIKLAAQEGLGETTSGATLHFLGWYNGNEVVYGIGIPDGLSILADHDPDATIQGLDTVPVADQPSVNTVRFAFQGMVFIGSGLLLLGLFFGFVWWRKRRLPETRWFWRAAVVAAPLVCVALICGWIVTEVGRQPRIVYDIFRVEDAVSAASGLRAGYFALLAVYTALTVGAIYVLRRLARSPIDFQAPQEPRKPVDREQVGVG